MLIQAFPRVLPKPDPERGLAACTDCGTWFDPAAQGHWHCPRCSYSGRHGSIWAHQDGLCPACGAECKVLRVGYDVTRALCDCHLTPEQRHRHAENERRKQEEARAKRALSDDLRRQNAVLEQERRDAAACLADPDVQDRAGGRNDCRERGKPYAFCRSCRVHTMAGAGGAR